MSGSEQKDDGAHEWLEGLRPDPIEPGLLVGAWIKDIGTVSWEAYIDASKYEPGQVLPEGTPVIWIGMAFFGGGYHSVFGPDVPHSPRQRHGFWLVREVTIPDVPAPSPEAED